MLSVETGKYSFLIFCCYYKVVEYNIIIISVKNKTNYISGVSDKVTIMKYLSSIKEYLELVLKFVYFFT